MFNKYRTNFFSNSSIPWLFSSAACDRATKRNRIQTVKMHVRGFICDRFYHEIRAGDTENGVRIEWPDPAVKPDSTSQR